MEFKQWIIKNFKRSQAVKVYIAHKDRRVTIHWCIPDSSNKVKIGDMGYMLPPESLMIMGGIPTYFCNTDSAEPLNLVDVSKKPVFSSQDFGTAIGSKVAKEFYDAIDGSLISTEGLIIIGAVVLTGMGVAFYLNNTLAQILEALNNLGIV